MKADTVKVFRVSYHRGASVYHPRTLAAPDADTAAAMVIAENSKPIKVVSTDGITEQREPATVDKVIELVTMPRVLRDMYAPRVSRSDRFYDDLRAANVARVNALKRVKFARTTIDIARFINDSHTRLKCDGTISEIEQEFDELHMDYDPGDCWPDCADDAREILRYLCPDMPERVASEYDDTLRIDVLRAVSDAARSDYCAQFARYLVDGIVDAIDEALPAGALWAWCDSAGNPTAEYYECDRIMVAMPHRKIMAKDCPVFEYYSGDDKNADAADMLAEYITENASGIRPDFFGERGGRYGDSDEWPRNLAEYCEAAQEWKSARDKMRAKLKSLIRARAPLHVRAELVASVYGVPGAAVDGDE